jgi:hypothetical protein
MPTETANPSASEILADAGLVNGRISIAQKEILRRLAQNLPGVIAAHNTAEGLTGAEAIPVPRDYRIMLPGLEGDDVVGNVYVGVSVETYTESFAYGNNATVSIFSIDQRVTSSNQVSIYWETAELIRACLFPFRSGCVDAQGRACWRQLHPMLYEQLPSDWTEYSGTVCHFKMVQPPYVAGLYS